MGLAPAHSLRLVWLCLILTATAPSGRAQEVESGYGPLPVFEFHSGFWVNLHHFLYHEARARLARNSRDVASKAAGPVLKPAPGSAPSLSPLEQKAWDKAVAYYSAEYAQKDLAVNLDLVLLKNQIQKRQLSIKRAFPDTLDLLLICVESGMSIEAALRKVSEEVGSQSVALAEELTLTTAELSYLPDRRQAYENLAKRTDLEGVKSVCMALQQSERYGTSLASMLRVMAQENRDIRMSEAEKKAAGLPPKLTVPMMVFFLPVLFVVILGPAAIRVMALN